MSDDLGTLVFLETMKTNTRNIKVILFWSVGVISVLGLEDSSRLFLTYKRNYAVLDRTKYKLPDLKTASWLE